MTISAPTAYTRPDHCPEFRGIMPRVVIGPGEGAATLEMDRDAPSWIFLSAVRSAREAGWTVVSPLARYSVSASTRTLYLCRQR